MQAKHPNIINLIEANENAVLRKSDGKEINFIMIVLELA
jgi:hypothetical protein